MPFSAKPFNKIFGILLLTFIPLILFFGSLDTIKDRDKSWYGGGYDPEYAYLFNSLNMARLKLAGHIDHPGTTMQVTGGLILRASWLIDKRDETLTKAVLSEPEHYIRILNNSTAVIGSVALWILSSLLLIRTGNFWFALLFQATPFISGFVLFNGFTRITQELMQMVAAFALSATAILWYIRSGGKTDNRYILLFGIISGFGIASKILFIPLMIIPLVIINGLKSKIRYILTSVLAFVVFTLPVAKLYPNMIYWIYRLFVHSGQYGSGEMEIVDTSRYFDDLVNLFIVSPILSVIVGLSIVIIIISVIKKRISQSTRLEPYHKVLIAVTLAQVAGFLLVAKQPKESYLLPYECVAGINAVIILHVITSFIRNLRFRYITQGILTLLMVFFVVIYGNTRKLKIYSTEKNAFWENHWQAVISDTEPRAVIFSDPGSSPISGLYFGNAYSIRRYVNDLQTIYPDYYVYERYSGRIYHWGGEPFSISDLTKKYNGRVFYSGQVLTDKEITEFFTVRDSIAFQKIYGNDRQVIMALPETSQYLVFSSAEAISGDLNLPLQETGMQHIGILTDEKAFAGKTSAITTPEWPYAFSVAQQAFQEGDSITVSVMVQGTSSALKLVASADNSSLLYMTASPSGVFEKDDWKRIVLNLKITKSLEGLPIKFYAYNNGNKKAYFDNFRLEVISKQPRIFDK
ncbi:MAG: hypothetical protein K0B15_08200 [Lentimicrobium sp.]|nr:hypothetical protein [Lentimicrobium sp.]